jgi:hypothetical protein
VRDLISATGTPLPSPVRMLVIGDRDYRTDAERTNVLREHKRKAKTDAYKLDAFAMAMWQANEIENYLLDRAALASAVANRIAPGGGWSQKAPAFEEQINALIANQRENARQQIATRIQQKDRRLDLAHALQEADEFLAQHWGDGWRFCDAKGVISGLRKWLQDNKVPAQLADPDIVGAMSCVPDDVQRVLKIIQRLASASKPRRRRVPAVLPSGDQGA